MEFIIFLLYEKILAIACGLVVMIKKCLLNFF